MQRMQKGDQVMSSLGHVSSLIHSCAYVDERHDWAKWSTILADMGAFVRAGVLGRQTTVSLLDAVSSHLFSMVTI